MKGPHIMRWSEVIRINYDLFDYSIQKDDKKVQRIRKEDSLGYVWIYSDKNKEKRYEPTFECTTESCAEDSKKENEFIKYVAEQFGFEIIDDLINNPTADYTYLFRFIGGFFPIRYVLGRYSKGYLEFLEKYNIKLESKYIGNHVEHVDAYYKYLYPSNILYDNV